MMKVVVRANQPARAMIYTQWLDCRHAKTTEIYDLFTLTFPITENSCIALAHSLVTTTRKSGGIGEIYG
jgi:hypothetical protein